MKAFESDEEQEDQLGLYQKQLRERANQSLQQLSGVLEQLHHDDEEKQEAVRYGDSGGPWTSTTENNQPLWSQKKQSEAVNQLKSLLLKQGKEMPAPLSPSKDLVPVTHNPPDYIQHLEAEVRFCKEEQQGLKQRIRVVVVENEKLRTELQAKHADMSLKDHQTFPNRTVNENVSGDSHMAKRGDHTARKHELEQLKVVHQAQIETLEAQVISLRRDLSLSQKDCEELTACMRNAEKEAPSSVRVDCVPRVSGLCLKCAQQEALLAGAPANAHVQALDRLTKERDELLAALSAARSARQEFQQREWTACLQVKGAVEMAEEAHLHKAEVEVQCQQLSRELARQTAQRERDAQALKDRIVKAREEGRSEGRRQEEELANTVAWLSQRTSELEGQLDRLHTDKSSLTNQLEGALQQLASAEQDNSKVRAELQYQVNHARLKKEDAERELQDLKSKSSRQLEKSTQEVEKLSSELVGCRQRLEAVQRDGGQWQAEALSLAEQLANAQRQLHLTREDNETAARAHEDKMACAARAWRDREGEMTALLQQMEMQHLQRAGELDRLLSSQTSLIKKLKEECRTLGAALEELTGNRRREVEQLAVVNQHLQDTVKSTRARCLDMEKQCVQHGRVHHTMKNRAPVPAGAKTAPQHDAATPMLHSWDGVLRSRTLPLFPADLTLAITAKQLHFSFIRPHVLSPELKIFVLVSFCKL
ncbi:serologically defined colon cancer antigen 8 homolog isoform X1 [Syngnathoides biaculeatus]|uniref:serologically defined colon cancer antigen 8 homolog isoform X1 n=2 Tax=Syngnathoides biaculeatus TaxID=300417 RepID=UPI002ADE6DBC|nr:serologically defined colon cancer antigen 8 homolog isoform X1 [Syngnathoides biaculeatus]